MVGIVRAWQRTLALLVAIALSASTLVAVSLLNASNAQAHTGTSVSFNANGGVGNMADQVAASPAALRPNTFTRDGYIFASWNTQINGQGTSYADKATYPFSGANITLYAQWSVLYTLTYDGNNASTGSPPAGDTQGQGSTVTVADNTGNLAKTNYTFNGWNTQANGRGTSYQPAATFSMPASNVTLYAQWLQDPTVTFDSNDGSGSMPDQVSLVATNLDTNTFTRTGYTFNGWNTQPDGSGTSYADQASFPFTTDTTLYAQWTVNSYTLAYDGNGESGGAVPTGGSIQYGSVVTVAGNTGTLTKANYTFSGWNTQADGNGTDYLPAATLSMPANNVTLFAVWAQNYTVTFDSNDGSGSMPNQSSAVAANLDTNTFTRTGYTFNGWNTQPDGSGTSYADQASFPFTTDTTLYAQWFAKTYPLIYDGNGANTGSPPAGGRQTYGSAVAVADNTGNLAKTGYTFNGWNTAANGSGTSYQPTATFSMPANSVKLYAQWSISSYTLAYDGNGESGGAVPTGGSIQYGSVVTVAGNTGTLTKANYTFSGWNTQADGNGTDYMPTATLLMPANNVTLYAQWVQTYTVTFNSNGGDGLMPDQVSSVAANLDANTFTKTDSTFLGWNTHAAGDGMPYADQASFPFTADATLYAQWNEAQVITFSLPATVSVQSQSVLLNATASSGLPVSYMSETPTVCTVAGSTAMLLTAGTCTITATQAGDVSHMPADPVSTSLIVSPLPSTVLKKCDPYSCAGADLAGVDLANAGLSGISFAGADLSGTNLNGANLSGANLTGAKIWQASFVGTNLTNTTLRFADSRPTSAALSVRGDVDRYSVTKFTVNFKRAILTGIDLRRSHLPRANFAKSTLVRTNFTGANLRQANLAWANAHKANFTRANLRGANLHHTKLTGANMKHSKQQGVYK